MSQSSLSPSLNEALHLFEFSLINQKEISLSPVSVSLSEAHEMAKRLAEIILSPSEPISIFLEGQLGAGKTTFCQSFITRWTGSLEHVESPTYAYVIPYKNKTGTPLYHFDLYRLRSSDEFIALGFDEYTKHVGISLIEWPQRLVGLVQKQTLIRLNINYSDSLDVREWSLSYKPSYANSRQ